MANLKTRKRVPYSPRLGGRVEVRVKSVAEGPGIALALVEVLVFDGDEKEVSRNEHTLEIGSAAKDQALQINLYTLRACDLN